ncbi:MAG: HEPN domain-containing protein [Tepidisphaeraceae bacterium]
MKRRDSDDPKAWFAKAEQDWRVAELALHAGEPLPEHCCYHSQQCAEKYLKGYLKSQKKSYRWSHELGYLIELCAQSHPEFKVFKKDAEILTRLAEPSRYPMPDEMEITEVVGRKAMEIAGRIRSFVLSRMGS